MTAKERINRLFEDGEQVASLEELMGEAFHLSMMCAYATTQDGYYHNVRPEGVLSEEEVDLVFAWADGLVQKYAENRMTGHCSLQATIDFDVEKFEERVVRDIEKLKAILARVGPPTELTSQAEG